MATAVQTIWLEHVNTASVLACLRYLVAEIETGRWTPDFQLLKAACACHGAMATFEEAGVSGPA